MDRVFVFIVIMTVIVTSAFLIATWMRTRARSGAATDPGAAREIAQLTGENDRLKGQIGRLEERLAVLERIATDPAERTARAIEELR